MFKHKIDRNFEKKIVKYSVEIIIACLIIAYLKARIYYFLLI